jgi:AraC-like DNA-binding protein
MVQLVDIRSSNRSGMLTRAGILVNYDELARTFGLDPRAMIRRAGLDRFDLNDADALIPAAAVNELLERSAEAAGVEDFGLRLATTRNLSQLGAIGLIVREEPTVGHAIKAAEHYFRLHSETLSFRLDEHDRIAVLRIQYLSATQGRTRQSTELIVGTVFRTLNVLAGRAWAPESVCFAHTAPRQRTIHDTFFRTKTLFDSGFDGFVLRTGDLTAPIRTADAAMTRYIRHYVDEVMVQPVVTTDGSVRQLVFALLPSGRATSEVVAQRLGVDRKTVHRRLAASGKTFSSILNEARIELAQRHIKTERRSLTETAQLLGFSGIATFSRWFRGEFGTSATSWRQAGSISLPAKAGRGRKVPRSSYR